MPLDKTPIIQFGYRVYFGIAGAAIACAFFADVHADQALISKYMPSPHRDALHTVYVWKFGARGQWPGHYFTEAQWSTVADWYHLSFISAVAGVSIFIVGLLFLYGKSVRELGKTDRDFPDPLIQYEEAKRNYKPTTPTRSLNDLRLPPTTLEHLDFRYQRFGRG